MYGSIHCISDQNIMNNSTFQVSTQATIHYCLHFCSSHQPEQMGALTIINRKYLLTINTAICKQRQPRTWSTVKLKVGTVTLEKDVCLRSLKIGCLLKYQRATTDLITFAIQLISVGAHSKTDTNITANFFTWGKKLASLLPSCFHVPVFAWFLWHWVVHSEVQPGWWMGEMGMERRVLSHFWLSVKFSQNN